ncbi:MAG: hypothetical protein IPQ19_12455 [Bacteroidetes bacterium]|nr:hypothetical protein [Bacteroidota bacterium]
MGSGSCDSVVTLNLTVSNVLSSNFAKTICSGQSYFFNGINQTTTGIYKDTLVGGGSCDSVVTLNLTVLCCFVGIFHGNQTKQAYKDPGGWLLRFGGYAELDRFKCKFRFYN